MRSVTGPPTLPSTRSVAHPKRLPPSSTPVAFPPPKSPFRRKPKLSVPPLDNLLPLSPSSAHMTTQESHSLPPNSVPPPPESNLLDSQIQQISDSQLQQESESVQSPLLINDEIQSVPLPQMANNATPAAQQNRPPESSPPPIQTSPPPSPIPPPPPSPSPSPPPPPPIPAEVSLSQLLPKTTQNSPAPPPIFVPPSPPPPYPQIPERSPPPPLAEPAQNTSSPPPPPPPEQQVPLFLPPYNLSTSEVSHPSLPASPPSSNSMPVPSTPLAMQTSPPPPSIVSSSSFSPPSPLIAEPALPNISSTSGNTPQSSVSTSGGDISTGDMVAIVLVIGFALLGISITVAFYVRMRKKKIPQYHGSDLMPNFSGSSPDSDYALLKVKTPHRNGSEGFVCPSNDAGGFANSKLFTYEELDKATDGFSDRNLLGEGGFGSVYKGSLPDGITVAVKQLKIGGGQGEREFRAEVEIISRIHHRHLVSLVGYCIIDNSRLLVYDYVPNNNLYVHLHGQGRPVLEWAKRVKVAVGAAHGIAYLHEDCHPRVIHRDIKSLNILLDNNFEAQVSDFGLAKLAMDSHSHVTTRVVGTFGYMAPEYASTGKLTEKSDVFSFGVVLLELITGRKPVDTSQPVGQESIVEWARPLLSHALETQEFEQLPDPRLERQYVASEMFQMIEAAAACVRHSSPKRPTMGQVVRALDSMATMDLMNGMKVGESGMFNSEVRLLQRMAFGNHHTTDFFRQDDSHSEYERLS